MFVVNRDEAKVHSGQNKYTLFERYASTAFFQTTDGYRVVEFGCNKKISSDLSSSIGYDKCDNVKNSYLNASKNNIWRILNQNSGIIGTVFFVLHRELDGELIIA